MNLSELDSLYAKSTPPDWRTRAEVDFFTALWDSYPALRDRLRALEAAVLELHCGECSLNCDRSELVAALDKEATNG